MIICLLLVIVQNQFSVKIPSARKLFTSTVCHVRREKWCLAIYYNCYYIRTFIARICNLQTNGRGT